MKKEDFVKLGISEEQATKAAEASAEELKAFIPKLRFDEVNGVKKQLEEDVKTRDAQIDDLKKVDGAALKAEIEKLQGINKADKEKFDADLKQAQINGAVERALLGSKAKNVKAVKALLDLTKAELDGELVKGLDDQIKKLKESDDSKFLFETETQKPNFKGVKPAEKSDQKPGDDKTSGLSLAESIKAYFEANTE